MNLQIITLFLATMTTGVMAGVFFTWTNAVTPGIGKLNDIGYLRALQSMNRIILNPTFYIVFTGPILMLPLATALSYDSDPSLDFKLLFVASVIYFLGVFLMTILGNIPLNNVLHETDLDSFNIEGAGKLRNQIEIKWNNFNRIRTISASIAFVFLISTCFIITK